jgi:hypothetical protein
MDRPDQQEPAVVVGKAYDFVLWLLPKVEKFSRAYRYTVGERLTNNGLDLLLALVEAAYASNKSALLQQATGRVNGLRYLLRLSKDLKLMTVDSYAFGTERLDEIGRMAGGWLRAVTRRACTRQAQPPRRGAIPAKPGVGALAAETRTGGGALSSRTVPQFPGPGSKATPHFGRSVPRQGGSSCADSGAGAYL